MLRPDRSRTLYTCAGKSLASPPTCPGVYRFFSEDNALLYVGKSIDMRTRLNSHYADAKLPGRQQQLMRAVSRIDFEPTAGETGALLLENAAIKEETPLYNRRQRKVRKLWTQRLQENVQGFLQVVPTDFCPNSRRIEAVYGLFRSRHHIESSLRSVAREESLCLRMLGLERGRGPCFAHQLKRCAGACCGKETPEAHNARLLRSLDAKRIAAWPFPAAIMMEELRTERLHEHQPKRQFHVFNHWSYQGSYRRRSQAEKVAFGEQRLSFDRDAYRIALRSLSRTGCKIYCGETGEELDNPLSPHPPGTFAASGA